MKITLLALVNILRRHGSVIIENSLLKNVLKITMSSESELGTLDYNIQHMMTSCESPVIKLIFSSFPKPKKKSLCEEEAYLFSEQAYLEEKNMDDHNRFVNMKSLI